MYFWNCSSFFITNFQNLLGYSHPFIIPDKPYNYHAKFWKGNPADILTRRELHSRINLGNFQVFEILNVFIWEHNMLPPPYFIAFLPLNKHFQLPMSPMSSLLLPPFFPPSHRLPPHFSPTLPSFSLSLISIVNGFLFLSIFLKLVTYLKNNYQILV